MNIINYYKDRSINRKIIKSFIFNRIKIIILFQIVILLILLFLYYSLYLREAKYSKSIDNMKSTVEFKRLNTYDQKIKKYINLEKTFEKMIKEDEDYTVHYINENIFYLNDNLILDKLVHRDNTELFIIYNKYDELLLEIEKINRDEKIKDIRIKSISNYYDDKIANIIIEYIEGL
ncbi:MAG: hypothetical protein Q4P31_02610 [Andreesenia angusta]|nr:hypothetical protein [Andreesenia angusta]